MDDIIVMNQDFNYLKKCLKIIKEKLNKEYLLEINDKKTHIVSCKEGFAFLGYNFKIKKNKIICLMRNETFKKIKKNIIKNEIYFNKGWITFEQYFSSVNHHLYSYNYGSSKKIKDFVKANI